VSLKFTVKKLSTAGAVLYFVLVEFSSVAETTA